MPGTHVSRATLGLAVVVAGAVMAVWLVRPDEDCYTLGVDKFRQVVVPPVTRTGPKPNLYEGQVVVGDGQTEWRLGFDGWVYVIPDGMLLRGGGAAMIEYMDAEHAGPPLVAAVHDEVSGSSLWFDPQVGIDIGRKICPTPGHDVHGLFDQIVASRQKHAGGQRRRGAMP